MNVILIISDTLRRDHLGCYGNTWIHTPNLDEFANKSIVFDQAYCASFPTVPNRNDVLTGRYTFTYKPWAPLDPGEVTLQNVLNEAGVITSLVVDTPHPFAPGFNYQRGFQAWELIRGQEHDPWKTAPRDVKLPCAPSKLRNPETTVVQYLRNVAWRRKEEDYFVARTMRTASDWLEENYRERFFLYVDTFDPHEPWDPPRHYADLYDPGYEGEEVIYPRYDRWEEFMTERELEHARALYAGEVTLVDRWIGKLLERAESLGLFSNTMIIVTTDHGFYLGEHGFIGKSWIRGAYHQSIPLYPEVANIPLLIHLPGMESGARIKEFAQSVDLMPTILDFFGCKIPESVQGLSLKPVLEGKETAIRDFVVSSPTISSKAIEIPHPTNRSSIYNGEWLLVYGSQAQRIASPEVTSMVDSLAREIHIFDEGPISPELYHLTSDPGCTHNVIDSYPDIAAELHRKYFELIQRAGVPEEHLRFFRDLW